MSRQRFQPLTMTSTERYRTNWIKPFGILRNGILPVGYKNSQCNSMDRIADF